MGRERYVVEAVVLEGRARREVARSAGISKAWVDKLVARYREGGLEALTPRSRRLRSVPQVAPPDVQAAVLERANSSPPTTTTPAPIPSPTTSACAPATAPRWTPSGGSSNATARSPLSRRSGRSPPSSASRPHSPTRCGRGTPPTGPSPTAPRRRDPQLPRRSFPPAPVLRRLFHRQGRECRPDLLRGRAITRVSRFPAHRQRRRLHRHLPQGQGASQVRARATRRHLQAFHAVPPAELRQGRALPPDPQALPRQASRCP